MRLIRANVDSAGDSRTARRICTDQKITQYCENCADDAEQQCDLVLFLCHPFHLLMREKAADVTGI